MPSYGVNFNEGWDVLKNNGLDGLPVANKLWIITTIQTESMVGPTATLSSFTQAFASKTSATGLLSSARAIDLGAFNFTDASGTAFSLLVCTNDPAVAGAKAVALSNIYDDASVYNAAVKGPLYVDSLAILDAHQGE